MRVHRLTDPVYSAIGGGRTMFDLVVENNTPDNVGPIVPIAMEWFGPASNSLSMLDTYEATPADPAKAARLAPGQATVFHMKGLAATPAGQNRYYPGNVWAEAEPLADQTVYRFYNKRIGTHFYTASPAERDNVIATLPKHARGRRRH